MRCNELDDYLSIILNLALRFGGNGFYQYHKHFASEAAARLSQFNEATYWGTLDNKVYCLIFAARAVLTCSLCGAPSHPASSCSIPTYTEPHQSRTKVSAFSRLSPAPITPKHAASASSVNFPITKGIDKKRQTHLAPRKSFHLQQLQQHRLQYFPMPLPPCLLLLRRGPHPPSMPAQPYRAEAR